MSDLENRNLFRPVIRSWAWVLVFGGGLLLEGAVLLLSSAWLVVFIGTHDTAIFRSLLGVPAGVFSMLSGWQFIRCARLLAAASNSETSFSFREYGRRTRLAFIFGGCATLWWLFMAISAFMFGQQP